MDRLVIGVIGVVLCILSIGATNYCFRRYRRRMHVSRSIPNAIFIWSAIAVGSGYISYVALAQAGTSGIIEGIQGALTMLR